MQRPGRILAVLLLAIAVTGTPSAAQAITFGEVGETAYDLLVLRPLHGAALALGAVFFTATLPLTGPVQGRAGIETAYETYLLRPYEYVVRRPLRDF